MFSKPDAAAAPRPAGKSVLAHDLKITGDVTTTGSVEVHGVVEGNVAAQGFTIGPDGMVKGTVSAESFELKGRFEGRASTDTLTLRASADVKADITYAAITIESGARIEGRFTKAKKG